MWKIALAIAVLAASPAAAQQILPQEYRGVDGKYEMCIKRHILELREVRGVDPQCASASIGKLTC